MVSYKLLAVCLSLLPHFGLADAIQASQTKNKACCLPPQDDSSRSFPLSADIEAFTNALDTADTEAITRLLQHDPTLATAILPSDWPMFLVQSTFPKPEIIDLMIKYGADPNARNSDGETLLHLTGDPAAIRKLVSHGADINALDGRGYTPMMGHALYPETGVDAIYTLFAAGADPNVIGADGLTVFDLLPQDARFTKLRQHLRNLD